MGAKLFKSVLLYQGENINDWFEIRDLRNEIAHDYDDNDLVAVNILNMIYKLKDDLEEILESITLLVDRRY